MRAEGTFVMGTCLDIFFSSFHTTSDKSHKVSWNTDTAVEGTPLVDEKDSLNYASLAHILKVLELMGCKEEY